MLSRIEPAVWCMKALKISTSFVVCMVIKIIVVHPFPPATVISPME
ncbi:hypothetical protein LINPERHAP1_LOCUS19050 [Linum perenne]